ncbi:MAG: glutaredoxin family protein [Dissulfurispiraceae bacterium]|jgi:glutaredoxin|nr:glutaredoxin family protein [Dissulfurispiraceae bacterium]
MSLPVKMYTLSTCVHCNAAKKMLNDCSIKFDFTDIDLLEGQERENIIAELKKFNERCTFPTIVIGSKVIVGFREDEIKKALGL